MLKTLFFLVTFLEIFSQSTLYLNSKGYNYFSNILTQDYIQSSISLSTTDKFNIYQMTKDQFNQFVVFYPVGNPFTYIPDNSATDVQIFTRTNLETAYSFYWVILNNSTKNIQIYYTQSSTNMKRTSKFIYVYQGSTAWIANSWYYFFLPFVCCCGIPICIVIILLRRGKIKLADLIVFPLACGVLCCTSIITFCTKCFTLKTKDRINDPLMNQQYTNSYTDQTPMNFNQTPYYVPNSQTYSEENYTQYPQPDYSNPGPQYYQDGGPLAK